MYVKSVTLKNIRGFRELSADFERPDQSFAGWTVLAGRNGSGKTTLLRMIALGLLGGKVADWFNIDRADLIRQGAAEARMEWTFLRGDEDRLNPDDPRLKYIRSSVGLKEGSAAWVGWPMPAAAGDLPDPLTVFRDGWFLAGYGPSRKLLGDPREPFPPFYERLVTLFKDDAPLTESVRWLKELHYRELSVQDQDERRRAKELISAVFQVLRDDGRSEHDRLLPDHWVIERVDADGLWARHNGVALPFRSLSDGYRSVAALVLDILKQLHAAYGALRVNQSGVVDHEGVVLIDEPDAHLHISWQKSIGFWLRRHFPKVQFIVATHSPYVCQAADPGGLIRLKGPEEQGDNQAEHVSLQTYKTVVHGEADEAAMSELFGIDYTHSDASERLRDRVAVLGAKVTRGQATSKEKQELDELLEKLPNTPLERTERVLRTLGSGR